MKLLRTGRDKKVLSSHFRLELVGSSIHHISPLSFLLAAISVASRLTSPRPVMLQERQRCGVTVTRKRQALRTSMTWHGFYYMSILAAEHLSADTKKSFFWWKFWGCFGPHKGRGRAVTLCVYWPLPGSPLGSLLRKLLRYKCNRHILSRQDSGKRKRSECLKAFSSLQSVFIFNQSVFTKQIRDTKGRGRMAKTLNIHSVRSSCD